MPLPTLEGLRGLYTTTTRSVTLEIGFLCAFSIAVPRMSISEKQGTPHRKWELFISINVLGFYLGQQEGPAHLSNGQGRTAEAGPHDLRVADFNFH